MTRDLIIFEGIDGGGKTSAAKSVSSVFGLPMLRRAADHNGPVVDLESYVAETLAPHQFLYGVLDRHPVFSGPVYDGIVDPIASRNIRYDHPKYDSWVNALVKRAVVVMCMPPFDYALRALQWTPQPDAVVNNFRTLYEGYEQQVELLRNVDFVMYDYTSDPINTLLERINKRRLHVPV